MEHQGVAILFGPEFTLERVLCGAGHVACETRSSVNSDIRVMCQKRWSHQNIMRPRAGG